MAVGFGHLPNESGEYPQKNKVKVTQVVTEAPDPEADSVAAFDGSKITYSERTAETGSRSYAAFDAVLMPGTETSPGSPVRLVGVDDSRARCVITNTSVEEVVYLGPADQLAQGGGFPLPPGVVFDPQVQGAIYACLPPGATTSAVVGVWVESDL